MKLRGKRRVPGQPLFRCGYEITRGQSRKFRRIDTIAASRRACHIAELTTVLCKRPIFEGRRNPYDVGEAASLGNHSEQAQLHRIAVVARPPTRRPTVLIVDYRETVVRQAIDPVGDS